MNVNKRVELINAMNILAKSINNEDIFELWLINGVADGTEEQGLIDYTDDNTLMDLMRLFLRLMNYTKKDGGLYCDGICSEK